MTFYEYATKIKYLHLRKYALQLEMAQEGPYVEKEVRDNPYKADMSIEVRDYVKAIEELDEQIFNLIASATKEEWFSEHNCTTQRENNRNIDRENGYKNFSLAHFPF